MAYFKIGTTDFSNIVNSLSIQKSVNYNAQTNAAGDTVVDYINTKRKIEVGFIPLNASSMATLQNYLGNFSLAITVLNPQTNKEETIYTFIPENGVEYYTIQADKTLFKAFKATFIEL